MKALKDMSPEELDLLFFEYLEEELPAAEAETLEQRLAKDPSLQEELDSWKDTYISQEFYDTASLEAQLETLPDAKIMTSNHQSVKFPFSVSLNALVFMAIFSLLGFVLNTDGTENKLKIAHHPGEAISIQEAVAEKQERVDGPGQEEKGLETEVATSVEPAAAVNRLREEVPTGKVELHPSQTGNIRRQGLPVVQTIAPDLAGPVSQTGVEADIQRARTAKQESKPKISRKQQRMIRRNKDKALQNRKAREFMKGNVPYVVPLNSQNF